MIKIMARNPSSLLAAGAMALLLLATGQAQAVVDIRITEIWAGGLAGAEAISDWFELTNLGDMDATGLSGNLYYDDNSNDPTVNDPLLGIDTIAAGESVVYLVAWEDDYATANAAIAAFEAMWGPPAGNLSNLQIGYVLGGGGLGGGGDRVNIYDGNTANANLIAEAEYLGPTTEASFVSGPDGVFNPGGGLPAVAQVGVLGAYAGNLPASNGAGIGNAVGSPGVIPEPSSLALLSVTLLGVMGLFRGKR